MRQRLESLAPRSGCSQVLVLWYFGGQKAFNELKGVPPQCAVFRYIDALQTFLGRLLGKNRFFFVYFLNYVSLTIYIYIVFGTVFW